MARHLTMSCGKSCDSLQKKGQSFGWGIVSLHEFNMGLRVLGSQFHLNMFDVVSDSATRFSLAFHHASNNIVIY